MSDVTTYRFARNEQEVFQCLELVQRKYVELGYAQSGEPMRWTPWHGLSTTRVAMAERDGRILATVTCVIDTPELGLPCEGTFADQISEHIGDISEHISTHELAGELTCFAAEDDVGMTAPRLLLWALAEWYQRCDVVIGCCQPHHLPFWKRFGHAEFSSEEVRQAGHVGHAAAVFGVMRPVP